MIAGRKRYRPPHIGELFRRMQTQGHEALDVLHGLVYAPVALAIQAQVGEECVNRLKAGRLPRSGMHFWQTPSPRCFWWNSRKTLQDRYWRRLEKLGSPQSRGRGIKYEMIPMFYRVSGTFRKADPTLEHRMIRINPMRPGRIQS